jgi:hypothetical protein
MASLFPALFRRRPRTACSLLPLSSASLLAGVGRTPSPKTSLPIPHQPLPGAAFGLRAACCRFHLAAFWPRLDSPSLNGVPCNFLNYYSSGFLSQLHRSYSAHFSATSAPRRFVYLPDPFISPAAGYGGKAAAGCAQSKGCANDALEAAAAFPASNAATGDRRYLTLALYPSRTRRGRRGRRPRCAALPPSPQS